MNPQYRDLQGGLFVEVTKADVGDAAAAIVAAGGAQMAWADPFLPDASMPASVTKAMQDALATGTISHYEPPVGNMALRRVVAEKIKKYNGIDADPARNIIITPGSDSGLMFAMLPFLERGDEVLVPDPSYPSLQNNCRLLGTTPVPIPLRAEHGYQLRLEDLEAAVTPRTKMVLMAHPNNPTATVFRRENLEDLARFCVKHDLVLVSDQAFEDHIYDGIEFVTPAALPGMWERTVTTFSLSKGLGLSGLRVGYLLADERIMDKFYATAVSIVGTTNTLAQIGAITALEDPTILPAYTKKLEARRHVLHNLVKDIPGVNMQLPESGCLAWLDVNELGTEAEVARYLADEAKVLVNEGIYYGDEGKGHIRIVYGVLGDDQKAADAYHRIADALRKLSAKVLGEPSLAGN
jgi:aspartate/methionine/tyrosine aminotransferase